jgi:hypothetical protein
MRREPPTIARLRQAYRPETVRILLVGESAPAGGTHYYLANSVLFSAVREAFVVVYGRQTPMGSAFLEFAASKGLWLVDLAAAPVDKLPQAERSASVRRGVPRLASVIGVAKPDFVVACLVSIANRVDQALDQSEVPAELVILPFPSWYRQAFVQGLATTVRRLRIRARTEAPPN